MLQMLDDSDIGDWCVKMEVLRPEEAISATRQPVSICMVATRPGSFF